MTHANAPLNIEGRRRLVERCRTGPIAHVAAEAGVSRACLSPVPRPDGSANRRPSKRIVARYPVHMVHRDVGATGIEAVQGEQSGGALPCPGVRHARCTDP